MTVPALETRGLEKAFGGVVVADRIDLRLEAGARHALIGPNGAGKTSFLNLVTGRLAPSAGQILLAGEDVTRVSQHGRVRRGLGRTFQITALFPALSVLENVVLAVQERRHLGWRMLRPAGAHRECLEEAHGLLVGLGLAGEAARPAGQVSYGQQRLVEIALALALRPRVLLLDEPAAGVPSGESGAILDALAGLPAGIAILIIEHDMDLVFRFAREITVLDQGRVVAAGPPEAIAADEHVRAIYFGHRPAAHA
jgi:branched-chain amino acid transport system ATP-binding protein